MGHACDIRPLCLSSMHRKYTPADATITSAVCASLTVGFTIPPILQTHKKQA